MVDLVHYRFSSLGETINEILSFCCCHRCFDLWHQRELCDGRNVTGVPKRYSRTWWGVQKEFSPRQVLSHGQQHRNCSLQLTEPASTPATDEDAGVRRQLS